MNLQVSDALLPMIKTMIQLESLHLGQVRITRERLEDLCDEGRCGLRELTVHGVEITPGSLVALHGFKNLMAVGMSACHQVQKPSVSTAKETRLVDLNNPKPRGPYLLIALIVVI